MHLLKTIQKKNQIVGSTLIETIVYLGILLVVTAASVSFMFSLNNLVTQYQVETELYRSGVRAMEQIMLSLRQAEAIDMVLTTEDDLANGRLVVGAGTSTTEFRLEGNALNFRVDGVLLGDLTGADVFVEAFGVYHQDVNERDFIRVRLDLRATIGDVTKRLRLTNGSVVRGTI